MFGLGLGKSAHFLLIVKLKLTRLLIFPNVKMNLTVLSFSFHPSTNHFFHDRNNTESLVGREKLYNLPCHPKQRYS